MAKKRIALIGYGALGRIIFEQVSARLSDFYEIIGVLDANEAARADIEASGCKAYASVNEIIADYPDYVVEAAGTAVVRELAKPVVEAGISMIILSVGGLVYDEFRTSLVDIAGRKGCKIHVPSGAIGGFDLLRTLSEIGIEEAEIENFKPPQNLNGAPFLDGRDLPEDRAEVIFEGSAREAIKGFPKNVNVAISSGLAGIGLDEMRVMIKSDPSLTSNIHVVKARSECDSITVRVESAPDAKNPKSSTITAWSVVALLRNLASPLEFF